MKVKLDRHIQDYLEEFALTEREVVIYLTLLKTGPNTIMNLARETGIKRSTTHNNVEELIKKGLVSQTNYGERRMVVAEDPEKLKFLMDQKKWRIKKLEENLPSVIERINQMVPEAKEAPAIEVKYYDGKEGIAAVYKEAFSSKMVRSFVNLEKVNLYFPENAEIFNDIKSTNKDFTLREIVENSPKSKELTSNFSKLGPYEFKFAPSTLKLSAADVLVYEGKVVVVTLGDKAIAMEMNNPFFHDTMVGVFDVIWELI